MAEGPQETEGGEREGTCELPTVFRALSVGPVFLNPSCLMTDFQINLQLHLGVRWLRKHSGCDEKIGGRLLGSDGETFVEALQS